MKKWSWVPRYTGGGVSAKSRHRRCKRVVLSCNNQKELTHGLSSGSQVKAENKKNNANAKEDGNHDYKEHGMKKQSDRNIRKRTGHYSTI